MDTPSANHFVYAIQNLINDKVYIGYSINPKNRISSHFTSLKKSVHANNHLQSAYNLYGRKCFTSLIYEKFSSKEEAFNKEKELIQIFTNIELSYNMLSGGDGGGIPNEETRRKMSEAKFGYVPWNKGKKYTEEEKLRYIPIEARNKISIANSGINNSFYGKNHSKEAIEKCINNAVKLWNTEEYRNKQSKVHKNVPWSSKRRQAQKDRGKV